MDEECRYAAHLPAFVSNSFHRHPNSTPPDRLRRPSIDSSSARSPAPLLPRLPSIFGRSVARILVECRWAFAIPSSPIQSIQSRPCSSKKPSRSINSPARVVDDLADDTTDVTVLLSKVEVAETSGVLVVVGVGLEDTTRLPLGTNDTLIGVSNCASTSSFLGYVHPFSAELVSAVRCAMIVHLYSRLFWYLTVE